MIKSNIDILKIYVLEGSQKVKSKKNKTSSGESKINKYITIITHLK